MGTKKGNERHNDNPDNRKRRKRVPDDDDLAARARHPAPPKKSARKGAMAVEHASGEARGNRRHATEGGNIGRKKGS